MRQVVVIHGGNTYNTYEEYISDLNQKELDIDRLGFRDWKSRLGEELGEKFNVIALSMPNKQNARYAEWKIWFEKLVPHLNESVVLIGHSLGGLFLAKYLAEEKLPVRVSATLLVAAPYDVGIKDFTLPSSLSQFANQGGSIYIFHSTDDVVVPFYDAEKYKAALPNATLCKLQDRGHFNTETFPEIITAVRQAS